MDDFYADLHELNELAVDLTHAADKGIGQAVNEIVRKTTYDIEATAKKLAPYDLGTLRSSISHSDLRTLGHSGVMEVEIGPTVEYGAYVEFGTSRQAPAAYMGPALDRHAPDFVAALEKATGETL